VKSCVVKSVGQGGIAGLGAGPLGRAARARVGDLVGKIGAAIAGVGDGTADVEDGTAGVGDGTAGVGDGTAGTRVAVGGGATDAAARSVGATGVAAGLFVADPQARRAMSATGHNTTNPRRRFESLPGLTVALWHR